jgi:Arc/MetJ-type ribon-helix-helix transcriptional regulator
MDVQLCHDLERLVAAQIESGRYARAEDVLRAVREWLRERDSESGFETSTARRPMSDEEFRQHLLRTGRVSQLPVADRKDQAQDPWKPIRVEGEPVSQTILRERR